MGRSAARSGRVATVTILLTAVLLAASGPFHARAAAAPSVPLAGAAAVGAPAPPAPAARSRWSWPLHPRPAVLRSFAGPPEPWAPGHRGVDLAAAPGRVVLAPAAGVVAFSGPVAGRGVVSVQHLGGFRSSLEPVRASLPVGTAVAAGDVLGVLTSEASHCSGGCLHWGVRRDGGYVDPLGLLDGHGPAVLLPLTSSSGGPVVAVAAAVGPPALMARARPRASGTPRSASPRPWAPGP